MDCCIYTVDSTAYTQSIKERSDSKRFAKAYYNSSLFYRSSEWTQGSQQVAVWNNKRSLFGTFQLSEIVMRQAKVISPYFEVLTLGKVWNLLKFWSHSCKANGSISSRGQILTVLWKVSSYEFKFIWQVKHVAMSRKPATRCGSGAQQKEPFWDLLLVSGGYWEGRKTWFIIIIIIDLSDKERLNHTNFNLYRLDQSSNITLSLFWICSLFNKSNAVLLCDDCPGIRCASNRYQVISPYFIVFTIT